MSNKAILYVHYSAFGNASKSLKMECLRNYPLKLILHFVNEEPTSNSTKQKIDNNTKMLIYNMYKTSAKCRHVQTLTLTSVSFVKTFVVDENWQKMPIRGTTNTSRGAGLFLKSL